MGMPRIEIESNFRNEPRGDRFDALVFGVGLSTAVFVWSIYFAVSSALNPKAAGWSFTILAVVFCIVVGLALLGAFIPPFVLRRIVTINPEEISYDDFWRTTRIPLDRVLGFSRVKTKDVLVILVVSKSGALLGAGHGFKESDKERLWTYLRGLTARLGADHSELANESSLAEWAKRLQKKLITAKEQGLEESKDHLVTRVVTVLGLGSFLLFIAALLAIGFKTASQSGFNPFSLLILGSMVALASVIASFFWINERFFWFGFFVLGGALILAGLHFIFAAFLQPDSVIKSAYLLVGPVMIGGGFFWAWFTVHLKRESSTDSNSA